MRNKIWCIGCSYTGGTHTNDYIGWPLGLSTEVRNYDIYNLGLEGTSIEFHSYILGQIKKHYNIKNDIFVICMTNPNRLTTWGFFDLKKFIKKDNTRANYFYLDLGIKHHVQVVTPSSGIDGFRKLYYEFIETEHLKWNFNIHTEYLTANTNFMFYHNRKNKNEEKAKQLTSYYCPSYKDHLDLNTWNEQCIDKGEHLSEEGVILQGKWVYQNLKEKELI